MKLPLKTRGDQWLSNGFASSILGYKLLFRVPNSKGVVSCSQRRDGRLLGCNSGYARLAILHQFFKSRKSMPVKSHDQSRRMSLRGSVEETVLASEEDVRKV